MRLDHSRPLAACLNAFAALAAILAASFIGDAAFINPSDYALSPAASSFLLASFVACLAIFVGCSVYTVTLLHSVIRDPYTYDDEC